MLDPRTAQAIDLMTGFADRTGIDDKRATRRYLWTDSFAVCNLLGLERATAQGSHRELALRLVDRVHHTLGRHRADHERTGWISGLDDREGEAHPTRGGLRIGKPRPERAPDEPGDDPLEWERDGQYFHYLTKWMHALDRLARATGQPMFNLWAQELAEAAHRAFTHVPRTGARKRMYWKMSIDLSRPAVTSMGHHDPLDGFVTYLELDATATAMGQPSRLADAAADFAEMLELDALATADPLGLGGLLVDAYRVDRLIRQGALAPDHELLPAVLRAALVGLRDYVEQPALRMPAGRRLAFRELGLAIGLAAVDRMQETTGSASLDQVAGYMPVRAEIESFWIQPAHRAVDSWLEHADMNDVMLATSLAPRGFLEEA